MLMHAFAGGQTLLQKWQDRDEQDKLLDNIAQELQWMQPDLNMLPRDPEVPGIRYKLSNKLRSCCGCCRNKSRRTDPAAAVLV